MKTDAERATTGAVTRGLEHPTMRQEKTLLVGDIGGTNARLAVVSPSSGAERPLRHATMPSSRYAGAEELIADFLREATTRIDGIVLAVAGPVVQGRAALSNLGWVVEERALRDAVGVAHVHLLNDLVALATAIPHLGPGAIRTLQPGMRERGGAIAVVAPGTGLGESFLTWDGVRYQPHPSEGGHSDFAPADDLQMELLAWMRRRVDHVSFERVCSGRALPDLYDFLLQRDGGVAPRPADEAASGANRTPAIVRAAFEDLEPCARSRAAVDLFAGILAAEAGNAAIRVMATGGVYLAGGMPRRILGALATTDVLDRFRRKGRLAPVLDRIPLHVVTQPNVALLGAAHHALSLADSAAAAHAAS